MNLKLAVLSEMLVIVFMAAAMPTEREYAEARSVVTELMSGPVAEQKAGRLTHVQVGKKAMELVDSAETDAARLLLVRGAVFHFAREGDPAAIESALAKLHASVKDVAPDFDVDVISRAVRMMQPSEGKKLHGMLDDARRLVSCRREVPILEKSLAKTDNPQKRARLAECHALLGDWKRAIDEFAKMDGKVGRVAKCEKDSSGAMTSAEVADFWWTYPGAKDRNGITAFQRHAVAWYGVALKDGSLTGLKRNLAEKRIADVQATVGAADAPAADAAQEEHSATHGNDVSSMAGSNTNGRKAYCVIDLSRGPKAMSYPVAYLESEPRPTWPKECKTKKLVLRRIPAGEDPLGRYSISRDFYIGVFAVSQKQWELVMWERPEQKKNDSAPVFNVGWGDVRGMNVEASPDGSHKVEETSFMGRLSARTGLRFDLPTSAQWEYASRAGTKTESYLGDGDEAMSRCRTQPNDWGVYDTIGKMWERTLDFRPKMSGVDPVGTVNGTQCDNCGLNGVVKRAGTNMCNPFSDRGFRVMAR